MDGPTGQLKISHVVSNLAFGLIICEQFGDVLFVSSGDVARKLSR